MRKYSLFLLLLFLLPLRVLGAGWTPSDAGLIVDLKPGDQFLLSVEINGVEYFVCDIPSWQPNDPQQSPFNYSGYTNYMKLRPQAAGALVPSEYSKWTVREPLTHSATVNGEEPNFTLDGICYTMWSSEIAGNTSKTLVTSNSDFKFLGELTTNATHNNLCDVVFVVPTVQSRTNMDPNNTLGKGYPFDGRIGVGFAGMVYREVYMFVKPRNNQAISYANMALVTFNTTASNKSWSAGTINPGKAAYAFADTKHNPTTRVLFRLYNLSQQFGSCPDSYYFSHNEQDYVRYRDNNNTAAVHYTSWRKTYTTDHHHCMERIGDTKYYQTEEQLKIPESDSSYFYIGKKNEYYSSAKGNSLGSCTTPKAFSQFRNVRQMRVRNLKDAATPFIAPTGAYGRIVIDTTSCEENLGAAFEPAGYFFRTNSGMNVRMQQLDDTTWITDEMWTITGDYILLSGEILLYTGAEFSSSDPGVAIDGWTTMQAATSIPVYGHPGWTAEGRSGWARIHTNRSTANGGIEFVLANTEKCLVYDNNGFLGARVPTQYLAENSGTNKVAVRDARLREDFNFLGWATTPDGDIAYHPGDSITLSAATTTLYAKATYTGSYNVAFSFMHSNGKRYFITNPGTAPVYLRARTYTDWTNVWQGMGDAYNTDPNYLSTYHPIGQPICLECEADEYVLDPHSYTIHGYEDSLVLYESHELADSVYIGLYYEAALNTLLANRNWAGLFQSSQGWPTFTEQRKKNTKLSSPAYLHSDNPKIRTVRDLPNYVQYKEALNQFDGVATAEEGTDFQISNVVVADAHYVILPDTTDVETSWTESITFGFHESTLPTRHVWSKLIGKQLMAAMFLNEDTVYFHPNPDKIFTTASALSLSTDFRLTHAFSYIRDARVEALQAPYAVNAEDKPTYADTDNAFHGTVTSGESSPRDVRSGGNYIDIVDTLRVWLRPLGTSKIRDYYGRWKTGAAGVHVRPDGSRYRDILVTTKTYHYGPDQTEVRLVPAQESYTFGSLDGVSENVNFTLQVITSHQLLDVDGNPVREEIVSTEDRTALLDLTSGTTMSLKESGIFSIGTTTAAGVRLTTLNENITAPDRDTLTVTTTVTISGTPIEVTARVPLMQASTQGTELLWSAMYGGNRYFIIATSTGLRFTTYLTRNSRLVRNNNELIKGARDAANTDQQYITPWKWIDTDPSLFQLALKTEYGVNRYFNIVGSTPGVHATDSVVLTFVLDTAYTNSNGNYEEMVYLKYGTDKWLKFNGSALVLVDTKEEASLFSWAYMLPEYSLLNNGTYPSKDYELFGHDAIRSGDIQTRYKAYLDHSMLLNNQLVYLCKKTETTIANLIDPSKEWKTSYTNTLIRDSRVATPSGLSMTYDAATLTSTITSSGTSPLNVTYNGKYVNIVDTLDFHLTLQPSAPNYHFKDAWSSYSSVEDAHLKIPLIRKTYHQEDFDSLVCVVDRDENNYTFRATLREGVQTDSLHTFTLFTERRLGYNVFDVDSLPVASVVEERMDSTSAMDLTNIAIAEVRVTDEYGKNPTWCRIEGKTANTITVRCLTNGVRSPRMAYINFAYMIIVDGKMKFVNFRLTVSQASQFHYANNQQLYHTAGASGDPKMEDGRQYAHENKRVLYYYNPAPYNVADQDVELPVRERGFYGWWRWYREGNDQNGKDVSDTDIPDSAWIAPPRNMGKYNFPYRIIGDSVWVDEEDHSKGKKLATMGRFTVFHYPSGGYNNKQDPPAKSPKVFPPYNKTTATYVVDISNYYDNLPLSMADVNQIDLDMLDTMLVITEPTLSLREVFELHPWTEMAERMENYKTHKDGPFTSDKYMEDHVVMAPTAYENNKGGRLLLRTEQRYNYDNLVANDNPNLRHSESLLGYYMRDDNWSTGGWDAARKDTMIWCGGWDAPCQWYTYNPRTGTYATCGHPTTVNDDFLNVPAKGELSAGQEADTVIYCLRARSRKSTHAGTPADPDPDEPEEGDYWFNICRYKVIYHRPSKYGPWKETLRGGIQKALITNEEIEYNYEVLERLNFDYNEPGSDYHIYPHPLPWADGSYGYTYPVTPSTPTNRYHAEKDFPGPGEYALINKIPYDTYWHKIAQHGGDSTGYMIYCDGMSSSGQVAALTLNSHLCEGQKLYFSAYVANAGNQTGKANPNFTFSVQGSDDGETWEDITSFMTGDMPATSKGNTLQWSQIFFPIDHEEAYEHFRVRIYNMASSFDGNDFIIDDMCVFATKPPLIAYQANTKCVEANENDSLIHVVLRVDYGGFIDDSFNDTRMFYTVEQETKSGVHSFVPMLDGYLHGDTIPGADPSKPDTIYGWVHMPSRYYEPQRDDSIFFNLNQLADRFEQSVDSNAKNPAYPLFRQGYIKENLDGEERYVLYLVHKAKMTADNRYKVHMSLNRTGLLDSKCAVTSDLNVTNRMMLMLNGEEQEEKQVDSICGNATYDLSLRVKGTLLLDGTAPIDLSGTCYNDWLLYGDTAEVSSEERYGYKYSDIVKVVKDILRYEPMPSETNPNQFAHNLGSVSRSVMNRIKRDSKITLATTDEPYDVLANLVNNGFLLLYQSDLMISILSGDSAQYVIFPISGTGSAELHDLNMEVCPMPIVIKLTSKNNVLGDPIAVGGLHRDSTQLNQPVIVLADAITIGSGVDIPIDSIRTMIGVHSIELLSTNDPNFHEGVDVLAMKPDKKWPDDADHYYTKGDTMHLMPVEGSYSMRQGYSYTFNLEMVTPAGSATGADGCPIGNVPFTISYVPDYLRWNPQNAENSLWNNPDNWIGITAQNRPIHTDARFSPLSSTKVVIPAMEEGMPYPVIPETITAGDSVQEVGFQYNTCDAIRFLPGAVVGQPQNLTYNNVIVDMTLPHGKWALRSAPVKGMLSGDVFMANADLSATSNPWEAAAFDADGRNYSHGNASFWISVYSRETMRVGNGDQVADTARVATADWSKVTNALTLSLPAGQGYAVYTKTSPDAESSDAVVRLPKNDDRYYYFYQSGGIAEDKYEDNLRALRNTNAGGSGAGKLAFDPEDGAKTYTITNGKDENGDVLTSSFIFGNPTMAYIDIWGFIADNSLDDEFRYIGADGNWAEPITKATVDAEKLVDPSTDTITNRKRYLPPMNAIEVKVASPVASKTFTLNTSRVVISAPAPAPSPAPRRSNAANVRSKAVMTVTAINPASSRCTSRLILGQGFHDAIQKGEDAMLTTVNIDKYSNTSYPATPFNIYAAEGGYGLSVDLRDSIAYVPLSFYMSDMPFDPVTYLWFTGVNGLDESLVLYDAFTGIERPIRDGACLPIETPEISHQRRYYIRRPGFTPQEGTDPILTGLEPYGTEKEQAVKFILNGNVYILRSGHIYTMYGQKVR